MGWFVVFGLGFFFTFSAVVDDFGCAGDYVWDLEGDAGPGLFAFASVVDGDEASGDLEFGDVRVLVGDFGSEAILVEGCGALCVCCPDGVF